MLNMLWFSTRTVPFRSKSTPRGAGSGSRRMWLLSAISRNFSCDAIWNIQNATASTEKRTATVYWMADNRSVRLRRSSGIIPGGIVSLSLSLSR